MAFALVFLMSVVAEAHTVDEARALAHRGSYDQALVLLEELARSADASSARAELGSLLVSLGRFEQAEDVLRPLARQRRAPSEISIAYAELLVARGQLEEAARVLGTVVERERTRRPFAVFLRAEALQRLGRWTDARGSYEDLVADYDEDRADTAEHLGLVGIALHRLNRVEEANLVFASAVLADSDTVSARLGWAALFLDKYRPDEARLLANEILAINPNEPGAKVLLARTELALNRGPEEATRLAQEALEINPALPEAYELLAGVAIDDEEYGRAIEILGGVLHENPARLESLTLTAAAHYLLDEVRAYRRVERRVLRLNRRYARFYTVIGDYATHAFRYEEAVALYEEALALNANYWPAHIGLGIGLTRLGLEEDGLEYLRLAQENDPFNVRVYHLVNLYERVLPNYEEWHSEHFRYRVHQDERAVLETYVPALAEWVFSRYVERYEMEPGERIAIEIFANPETFAIRSVGLPHVGPHGICFGPVLISRSPNEGDFNWAEVLAHELSHVFTRSISDARVPRWLTEGMAEYDTSLLRPEWRREAEFELLTRLSLHGLMSVEHLNHAFLHSTETEDVAVAYRQSSLTVEFLSTEWEPTTPMEMLRLFHDRRRLPEVLREVTGLSVEEFDTAFAAFVRLRLSALIKSFEPNPALFRDEGFFDARVSAAPANAQAYAELAMAKFQALKIDECRTAFERALELDPENALANFLAASFAVREHRLEDARSQFEALLDGGHDGYTLRTELGFLSRRQGRTSDAIRHYRRAQEVFPNGVDTYRELADIFLRAGRQEDAILELTELSRIDQSDYGTVFTLTGLLSAAERYEEAWETCGRANNINPFSPDLHGVCGRVAIELELWEEAQQELGLELLLGSGDSEETEALLSRAREALGPDTPAEQEPDTEPSPDP